MKRKIIIFAIVVIVIVSMLFFILNGNKKNYLIKTINIEEGCYRSLDDEEHLICLTRNQKFYSVLDKYNTYYNDVNYYVPPKNDVSYGKYNFSFEYTENSFVLKSISDNSELLMNCDVKDRQKFICKVDTNSSGEINTGTRVYHKVDKEFTEEIILGLPVFERMKEYDIIFNGEKISCNLTWLYSIINTASGTSAIKQCLEREYNEEFIVSIPTDSQTKWLIKSNTQKIAFDKKFPGATLTSSNYEEASKYNNETFGFDVTASIGASEEKTFGIYDPFPYDPYDKKYENEKMTITITNKANTHVSTVPVGSVLQYNKKYMLDNSDDMNYQYYKFLDDEYVEYDNSGWGPNKYLYEKYDNQIIIKPGYPNKDVTCSILSDTIIHCDNAPYNDYIIQ